MGWHRRAGIGGRPAGNGVGHVATGGVLAADGAFQSADLGQMGPVAVAHQQVGGPSAYGGPLFDATTVLVNLHRLGFFQFPSQMAVSQMVVMSCNRVGWLPFTAKK